MEKDWWKLLRYPSYLNESSASSSTEARTKYRCHFGAGIAVCRKREDVVSPQIVDW